MNTPMSTLTISAPSQLLRDEDATAAARFADLLDLRQRAAARGYRDLDAAYTERIVNEIVGDSYGLNGPGGHAA